MVKQILLKSCSNSCINNYSKVFDDSALPTFCKGQLAEFFTLFDGGACPFSAVLKLTWTGWSMCLTTCLARREIHLV